MHVNFLSGIASHFRPNSEFVVKCARMTMDVSFHKHDPTEALVLIKALAPSFYTREQG